MGAAVSATMSAAFGPAWWLPSPHAQTFAGRYMRPRAAVPLERRRIGTPDGDYLDLDYAPEPAPGVPVVVSSSLRPGPSGVGMNARRVSAESSAPKNDHGGDR